MNVNRWLKKHRKVLGMSGKREFLDLRPMLTCRDGFTMSVQASSTHYCTPRSDNGPYTHVEVGYPSDHEPKLDPYDAGGVYAHVPVAVVSAIIKEHGGLAKG